ncbi:hypothetical protein M3P05_09240 [Sansalvadorimonas sp. 2012CJ34-2]|uniref:Death domain-containing protein n=1 Tax=Parendozoicomonas callyspongiae TaxID=2942213 RepID=A0ABT0PGG5_9GAMM|nr:hypothetical protein [Sansalvadorimonas sp. 2012CJ34-2]MCL6270116.1 hypothetical protein [Sansalvadorimonas sp. 2012CJ34-2]
MLRLTPSSLGPGATGHPAPAPHTPIPEDSKQLRALMTLLAGNDAELNWKKFGQALELNKSDLQIIERGAPPCPAMEVFNKWTRSSPDTSLEKLRSALILSGISASCFKDDGTLEDSEWHLQNQARLPCTVSELPRNNCEGQNIIEPFSRLDEEWYKIGAMLGVSLADLNKIITKNRSCKNMRGLDLLNLICRSYPDITLGQVITVFCHPSISLFGEANTLLAKSKNTPQPRPQPQTYMQPQRSFSSVAATSHLTESVIASPYKHQSSSSHDASTYSPAGRWGHSHNAMTAPYTIRPSRKEKEPKKAVDLLKGRPDPDYQLQMKHLPWLLQNANVGTDWYTFGISLGLDSRKLAVIEADCSKIDARVQKMYAHFLQVKNCTLGDFLDAMEAKCKMVTMAHTIARSSSELLHVPECAPPVNLAPSAPALLPVVAPFCPRGGQAKDVILTDEHLGWLVENANVATSWMGMGIQLGVDWKYLEELNESQNTHNCLTGVYRKWLSIDPFPKNLEMLISVLNKKSVGQNTLAAELVKKVCGK